MGKTFVSSTILVNFEKKRDVLWLSGSSVCLPVGGLPKPWT